MQNQREARSQEPTPMTAERRTPEYIKHGLAPVDDPEAPLEARAKTDLARAWLNAK